VLKFKGNSGAKGLTITQKKGNKSLSDIKLYTSIAIKSTAENAGRGG